MHPSNMNWHAIFRVKIISKTTNPRTFNGDDLACYYVNRKEPRAAVVRNRHLCELGLGVE